MFDLINKPMSEWGFVDYLIAGAVVALIVKLLYGPVIGLFAGLFGPAEA